MAFYDTDNIHEFYQRRIALLRQAVEDWGLNKDPQSAWDVLDKDDTLAKEGY